MSHSRIPQSALSVRILFLLKDVLDDSGDLFVMQLLVSGGVDSSVCAALLHKALREDQVIAVHIDNGFMRKNESQRVEQSLEKLGLRLRGSVLIVMILNFSV